MDRQTKATLWGASAALVAYGVWFFLNCALNDACRFVCRNGRSDCHAEWKAAPGQN